MNHLPGILLAVIGLGISPVFGFRAVAQSPEEIWKSLEKLPAVEREKKLVEGASSKTTGSIKTASRFWTRSS